MLAAAIVAPMSPFPGVRSLFVRALKPSICIPALLSASCAFQEHRDDLARLHAAGDYRAAAVELDRLRDRFYDDGDRLLWDLDRGAVALALGDTDAALARFQSAQEAIAFNDRTSAGESVAQWLVNDTAVRYIAEPYEDMYVSVLTMAALLESGRVQPGAANEARRFGVKSIFLRDRYGQLAQAVDRRAAELGPSAAASVRTGSVEFVESPLGVYLASLAFMAAGERDAQRVAAERLQDAVRTQGGFIGPVRADDFAGLATMTPADADVVVVAFSGRGPVKVAQRLPPIVIDKVSFYAEVPVLQSSRSRVTSAEVEVEGAGLASRAAGLALVEDLSRVAEENYRRTLPMVQARALLRATAKAGAAYAVTEAVDKSSNRRNDGARILTQLGLLAWQVATERADVRSWAFLPGQARVGTLKLPADEGRLRVVYRDAEGRVVHATPWERVAPGPEGLRAVVVHYWD